MAFGVFNVKALWPRSRTV